MAKKQPTQEVNTQELEALKTRIALDFPIARGKTVIILRGIEEELVEGGLIIPETSDAMKMRGTVMAVGPDVAEKFIDYKGVSRSLMPRDRVIFNSYANLNIIHRSISYVVMSELDVYCVIPENTVMSNDKHKNRKGIKTNWEG